MFKQNLAVYTVVFLTSKSDAPKLNALSCEIDYVNQVELQPATLFFKHCIIRNIIFKYWFQQN